MNETAIIFYSMGSAWLGYVTAVFFKRMGGLWDQWGFFAIFLFPMILYFLMIMGALVADIGNTIISIAYGAGFIVRILKRNE